MEQIVVKKKKSHRIALQWIAISGWILSMTLRSFTEDRLLDFLILTFITIPPILLYAYFEDWAITFYKTEIIRNRWTRLRRYTWNDIQLVTASRSVTEGEYIRILFRDGKAFQFRKEDEHAEDAVRLILKHTSIKSI